jgi:hypothetical protein
MMSLSVVFTEISFGWKCETSTITWRENKKRKSQNDK